MILDVPSLIAAQLVSTGALVVAVPFLMGWGVSAAARCAMASMLTHSLGWVLSFWPEQTAVTALSIGLIGASLALSWEAVRLWLRPAAHTGPRWLWLLAAAVPLGYLLLQHSQAWRTGWANCLLALQVLLICQLLWPFMARDHRRWPITLAVSLLGAAAGTAWRGLASLAAADGSFSFFGPHPANVVASLLINQAFVIVSVSLLVAWRDEAEQALQLAARTDALTGLPNRRAFMEGADRQLNQPGAPQGLALALLDLDHFKRINDTHGHATGDRALQLTASCLARHLRPQDLVCRWGGEEFCLLLQVSEAAALRALDQRLRVALAEASSAELGFPVHYSAGAALPRTEAESLDAWTARADKALYTAKAQGRGCLVLGD